MAKHQVFTTTEIIKEDRTEFKTSGGKTAFRAVNLYKFRFFTYDGSSIETYAQGEGIDYGDKLANKCTAIAHKYALIQVFCIPTVDMPDPDQESHEIPDQKKNLMTTAAEKVNNGFDPSNQTHTEFFKSLAKNAGIPSERLKTMMPRFKGMSLKEIQDAIGKRDA